MIELSINIEDLFQVFFIIAFMYGLAHIIANMK